MIYLLEFLLFCFGIFVGFYLLGQRAKWKRVIPTGDRGPNADAVYNCIEIEKERYAFTDEQLDVASERASKVWP
jgi:hypothetical protein